MINKIKYFILKIEYTDIQPKIQCSLSNCDPIKDLNIFGNIKLNLLIQFAFILVLRLFSYFLMRFTKRPINQIVN